MLSTRGCEEDEATYTHDLLKYTHTISPEIAPFRCGFAVR